MFVERTNEFYEKITFTDQKKIIRKKDIFYLKIYKEMETIEDLLKTNKRYQNILAFEETLFKLQQEVYALDLLKIEGLEDVFDGIKWILFNRLLHVKNLLKKRKLENSTEIYEEEYTENTLNDKKEAKQEINGNMLEQLECENKQILQSRQYEETQKKLRQINKVQTAIGEHLLVQNERIDDICETNKDTKDVFKKINKVYFNQNGSWFKRFVYKLILLFIFLLIILHYRNR